MSILRHGQKEAFKRISAASGGILLITSGATWAPKGPLQWTTFPLPKRPASSSSNRWQNRQAKDKFVKLAKVQGLKSRAAFKLLEVKAHDTYLS